MIAEKIRKLVGTALSEILADHGAVSTPDRNFEVVVDHSVEISRGDYSTNAAFLFAKKAGMSPRVLADKIVSVIQRSLRQDFSESFFEKIEAAGGGFINFFVSKSFLENKIIEIIAAPENFGRNRARQGQRVMVEYTDPNPFKEFHIGHLMSNAIGESIARLLEFSGARVYRASWQGDVGLHVAKAVWGLFQLKRSPDQPFSIADLGAAYVNGAKMYETDETVKKTIEEINRKIFDRSDEEINKFYEAGREVSLAHFGELYKKLGTNFDYFFFEGREGRAGAPIVEKFLKKGVFEKSAGAVVFRGERYGLHTRVFITSSGLPTYETKELGLTEAKFRTVPDLDESIVITANEQNDYFKVVLKVMELVMPEAAKKTRHIAHGLMRFAKGKMSSREGNVITGESLITAMENLVMEKIGQRDLSAKEKQEIAEQVAVGAIKFSILRSNPGSDIIYDFDRSISFEGDSGPYLQYTYARVFSLLRKAGYQRPSQLPVFSINHQMIGVARRLCRFPEVVDFAAKEFAPNHLANYLIELAGDFNYFYETNKIIGSEEEPHFLVLAEAVAAVIKNGLWLMGIKAPQRM
jgi:arginyl-tRNA synthetase